MVVTLPAVGLVGYYEVTQGTTTANTGFVTGTGTGADSAGDTFLTHCSITGVGGFQLRVVSDSTGAPVSGETINAVDTLGCVVASTSRVTVTLSSSTTSTVGQSGETQVVHLRNFSVGQGGWLTPVFPNQATPGGQLNFTVTYQGGTYNFSALVPPVGTSCVTLHVPSGNVTARVAMNGQGSYCWQ